MNSGILSLVLIFLLIHESEVQLEDETALSRRQTVKLFSSYLRETHDNPQIQIDEIAKSHIRGFRDHMMAAGHSATTINLRLHTLVTAFNEAKRQGLIDVNPANGVIAVSPWLFALG